MSAVQAEGTAAKARLTSRTLNACGGRMSFCFVCVDFHGAASKSPDQVFSDNKNSDKTGFGFIRLRRGSHKSGAAASGKCAGFPGLYRPRA